MISVSVAPANGGRLKSIMYSTTPADQTSHFSPYSLHKTSGAM